jgi:hypothetical protein
MVVAGVLEVTVRVQLYRGHRVVALLELSATARAMAQSPDSTSVRAAPATVSAATRYSRSCVRLGARGRAGLKIAAVSEGMGKPEMCSSRWRGTALLLR